MASNNNSSKISRRDGKTKILEETGGVLDQRWRHRLVSVNPIKSVERILLKVQECTKKLKNILLYIANR